MTSSFDLTLEASTTWAVLTLRGSVQHTDAATAVRLCLALPRRVRGLRVDLRETAHVSGDAHDAIVALIQAWRRARDGLLRIVPDELALEVLSHAAVESAAYMVDLEAVHATPAAPWAIATSG